MIIMIDNYDSFTYNLVQYLEELGQEVMVFTNDGITVAEIEALKPEALVISPGPSNPREAGISVEAVRHFYKHIPILGVCLGHQAIASAFGAQVVINYRTVHGKTSPVFHDHKTIYRVLPNPFIATRYHSLVVARETLPPELEVSSWTAEREVMGIRHRHYPVEGVQFHPESIMTPQGKQLLAGFLELVPSRARPSGKTACLETIHPLPA